MTDLVADRKIVSIHYTLSDAEGKELESTLGGPPQVYLHGASNLVPGLERELEGKAVGDTVVAVVPPIDGFGERSDERPIKLDRSDFPGDVELQPGMDFALEDAAGDHLVVWVVEVGDEHVLADPNHPLAGLVLHFDVEIVAIREATEDEIAHGHAHGPGGAH